MASLNSLTLLGRLVKDPETQSTKTGKTVCKFTMAVDKRGKDAGANFIDCVAWEQQGEFIGKYGKKGAQILVSGRLDQQTWEKDGKKQSKIVAIVDNAQLLSSVEPKNSNGNDEGWSNGHAPTAEEFAKEVGGQEAILDDIPF